MERLTEKPPCDRCRALKGERWDQEQCLACLPECLPENKDAIKIYSKVNRQLIMGINGPIDINHLAIYKAMDLYKIENQVDCFEKVLYLANHFIEKIRLQSD